MLYRRYSPPLPLGQFVDVIWLYEGSTLLTHEKQRLLPDGSTELVFNLAEDKIRLYDREDTRRLRGDRPLRQLLGTMLPTRRNSPSKKYTGGQRPNSSH